VGVSYFLFTKEVVKVPDETQPIVNVPVESLPPEPVMVSEESTVSVATDKSVYALGETIPAMVTNNTESAIWLSTACGMPITLLRKNGETWEPHGAYPTKRCAATAPSVESGETVSYVLDLENMYAHTFFKIEPGTYKVEVEHTIVDGKLWPVANFSFLKSQSEEFRIVQK
jgi:hypothetical protein